MLFSSKQLVLYPDQQFDYYQHEDAMEMGKQGAGTYRQRGQWLQLRFEGQQSAARSRGRQRLLGDGPDSLVLTFHIRGGFGADSLQPVEGATVLLRDAAGKVLSGVSADSRGRATLPFTTPSRGQLVEVTAIGFDVWQQAWPAQPSAFVVRLVPRLGRSVPAGTSWGFRQLPALPDQLRLRWGADTVRFLRRPLP
ncbi:carboxypeptidase-like regulatory domain-containing protein [Hymenobacter terrestris]|uniref:Carboxypeptidase regulatory-like domain-containing protein n=1 Tax=Hymenobacter terrestris TaxID=2748310 RepID=A0ABX2Q1N4_9BACT|nr:carboxypeptidase-like regulatory domain-containing protein [Hymenobacter terrestris]NVO83654.1 carboxypeptidase regulatory-like domain-containing protein [Hymenobacter terrestris]